MSPVATILNSMILEHSKCDIQHFSKSKMISMDRQEVSSTQRCQNECVGRRWDVPLGTNGIQCQWSWLLCVGKANVKWTGLQSGTGRMEELEFVSTGVCVCVCFLGRDDMSVDRVHGCVCVDCTWASGGIRGAACDWNVCACGYVWVAGREGGPGTDHVPQIWLFKELYSSSGRNETKTDHAVRLTFIFNFCIMEKFKDK